MGMMKKRSSQADVNIRNKTQYWDYLLSAKISANWVDSFKTIVHLQKSKIRQSFLWDIFQKVWTSTKKLKALLKIRKKLKRVKISR